jgi:hypothetical protein
MKYQIEENQKPINILLSKYLLILLMGHWFCIQYPKNFTFLQCKQFNEKGIFVHAQREYGGV